ncbi:tetratricopeptide repeat protein [Pinisolibacter sp.]|uniref:tetratricopeptide repeat protein n=1 Tax=Pinisolibacter sp. TaxID=2172024 RepID=UPI002FDE5FBF
MLARIFTRLFYAAVFFALGVWAAPSMGGLGRMIDSGVSVGTQGFDRLWAWAESTVSGAPAGWSAAPSPAARPVTAPAPVAAPAPKPVVAAAPPAPAASVPAAPAKPAPAPAAPPAAAPDVGSDLLAVARAAHARGDVTAAIRAYEDLIARQPKDAAVRGELGNVYWAAGRLQDAARSYHGAASVLIDAGRIADAVPLEAAIRKGDGALADDLARRLAAAGTKK